MSQSKTKKSTICLNMIVKNEAHIIKRCLESVIPHIDTWVISDTGSTDGTQDIIQDIMKDVPGELLQREWKNFGHNRNEVLQHSKGKADYILTIDADEWLSNEQGDHFSNLSKDSYYIIKSQPLQNYWVRNIVRNDMGWEWTGVLHEHLICDNDQTYGDIDDIIINARQEGARAHDPDTYRKDAAILTQALVDEPENTRYQFYLAQSWRDAGDSETAMLHYKRRVEMNGWEEEVFYSKYQIAVAMQKLGKPWNECLAAYLEAWQETPQRAEPLYKIGLYYIEQKNWPLAWLFLNQAANIEISKEYLLFIEEDVYQYMALFDSIIAAGNLELYDEVETRHKKLMQTEGLEENIIKHAKQNYDLFMSIKAEKDSEAA